MKLEYLSNRHKWYISKSSQNRVREGEEEAEKAGRQGDI